MKTKVNVNVQLRCVISTGVPLSLYQWVQCLQFHLSLVPHLCKLITYLSSFVVLFVRNPSSYRMLEEECKKQPARTLEEGNNCLQETVHALFAFCLLLSSSILADCLLCSSSSVL